MQAEKTITYNGKKYPYFQSIGFAAQFAIPYAKHICIGKGVDVGCMKKEWAFPNSIPIDPKITPQYHATNFPYYALNYIFSSHCLEHLPDWVEALDYWTAKLLINGTLFLYIPHYKQQYWRPWNNRKHIHCLSAEIIRDYMADKGFEDIFHSERDLNDSFMIYGTKCI